MENFFASLADLPLYEAEAPFERRMKVVFDDPENDLPFSVGQFIFEPGQSGPAHAHETEIEIYIVLSGKGTITFNNETSYPLTPEHMIYVPPKTLHETVNTGDEQLVFYGIFVSPVDLNGMVKNLRQVS